MSTYKPRKDFVQFLERCVAEGKEILNLPNWRINLTYQRVIPAFRHIPEYGGTIFAIEADQVYLEAEILVSLKAQNRYLRGGRSRHNVREDILHELAHIIVDPLGDKAHGLVGKPETPEIVNLEEHLVQLIANIGAKLLK